MQVNNNNNKTVLLPLSGSPAPSIIDHIITSVRAQSNFEHVWIRISVLSRRDYKPAGPMLLKILCRSSSFTAPDDEVTSLDTSAPKFGTIKFPALENIQMISRVEPHTVYQYNICMCICNSTINRRVGNIRLQKETSDFSENSYKVTRTFMVNESDLCISSISIHFCFTKPI